MLSRGSHVPPQTAAVSALRLSSSSPIPFPKLPCSSSKQPTVPLLFFHQRRDLVVIPPNSSYSPPSYGWRLVSGMTGRHSPKATASYSEESSSEVDREILVQHLLVKDDDQKRLLELLKRMAQGSSYAASLFTNRLISGAKIRGMAVQCLSSAPRIEALGITKYDADLPPVKRRDIIHFAFGVSSIFIGSSYAEANGLPPEEKPKLCDDTCEKELENVSLVSTPSGLQYKDIKIGAGPSPPVGFQVAANVIAMVPSGQIFDSSLEKGQIYIFRVGAGQVVKGLDEGILSMRVGGKRRLYIPGSLAFPKGLTSAPGRPRVAPNSPVVFDVSLEYIPGLEVDDEE